MHSDFPSILLVDDEKANLKILSELLSDEGQIMVAKTGRQAIEKAITKQPDLILLDVIMPEMDGFDVIQALKHNAGTQMIPVIFITGLTDIEFEEKGLSMGASDYIIKPFHEAVVKARVKLHLQLVKQRKMLEKVGLIDPLTTLPNRRKFEELADVEWRAAKRLGSYFSLAIINIDNFAQFNRNFGHATGDQALYQIANALSQQVQRAKDFVARFGGQEFVLLLPGTDRTGGQYLAKRCAAAVEALQIPIDNHTSENRLTVSIGGVSTTPNTASKLDTLVSRADQLVHDAKQKGAGQLDWLTLG